MSRAFNNAGSNRKDSAKSGPEKHQRRQSLNKSHLSMDLAEIDGHHAQKDLYRLDLPFADPEEVRTRPGACNEQPTDVYVFFLFSRFRSVDIKGGGVNVRFFLSLQWDTGLSGYQVAKYFCRAPHLFSHTVF